MTIGHNSGLTGLTEQLARDNEDVLERSRALFDSAARFVSAYPKIPNATVQATATEIVNQLRRHLAVLEDRRKATKEPYLTGGRAVDAWFNAASAVIVDGMRPVQAAMLAWAKQQDKQAAEAAEREARRLAEEAALAEQLADAGSTAVTYQDAAEAALAAEKAAELATAKPAERTRVRGDYGGVSSLKRIWRPIVHAPHLVPAIYLMPDLDAIKAAGKAADKRLDGKPLIDIPGVTWTAEESMTVR